MCACKNAVHIIAKKLLKKEEFKVKLTPILVVAVVLISFVSFQQARADTLGPITGIDAQATFSDGIGYVLNDGATTVNTQYLPSADVDRRGILEFDISSIPASAEVLSATLDLRCWLFSYTSSPTPEIYPSLTVFGYAGDGALSPSDATQTGEIIGQSAEITSMGPIPSISLNEDFIEALLDGGVSHLGMVTFDPETGHQVGFYSQEDFNPAWRPALTVVYTPEPTSLVLLAAGGMAMLRRRKRLSR